MQPDGSAVVAWTEVERNGSQQIYVNTFAIESGWSGPVRLSIHGHQENPYLAANSQGTAIVSWEASDVFGTSIVANRFDPGTGWGTSQIIDAALISSSFAHVAIDADGSAIAAWVDDFDQDAAYASLFSPGSGWAQARTLGDPQDGAAIQAIAVDSAGGFVVIWRQFEGSALYRLLSRHYSAIDGWSEPVMVGFDDGQSSISDLATDGRGELIAVGSRPTGFEMADIFALHRAANGEWGAPILLDDANGWARFPEIAAASDGNAISVYGDVHRGLEPVRRCWIQYLRESIRLASVSNVRVITVCLCRTKVLIGFRFWPRSS